MPSKYVRKHRRWSNVSTSTRAFLICVFFGCSVLSGQTVIDWTSVTLSGSFPVFTFSEPTLGSVTVTYSGDTEVFGITTIFASSETLVLGNTGGESVTLEWTNPVPSLDIRFWDVDATGPPGESVEIVVPGSIDALSIHPTDSWNAITRTLSSDLAATPNETAGNFSLLRLHGATDLTAVTLNWSVSPGTGALGIGDIDVPEVAVELKSFSVE